VHQPEDANCRFFDDKEKAVWKSGHARSANGSVDGRGRFGIPGEPVQRCRDTAQKAGAQVDLLGFVEVEGVEDLFRSRAEKDDPV
jgi:hypothetical protein